MEKYSNIAVKKLEKSEIEITGNIPAEAVSSYRTKALKEVNEKVNMDGFRKGHIPEKVLIERVGEMYILEEAAEIALQEIAPEIIEKNAPNYVGRPQISIVKLAPENPIEFKIVIATMPEFSLPDFKKIAKAEMEKESEKIDVTEKEIDDVVEEVRKQHAHREFHKQNKDAADHKHADEEVNKLKPDFTDDFVKTLGDFKDVADFRTKVKDNMTKEKEVRAKDKKRAALLDKLVAETTMVLPHVLVNGELDRMFMQFESDVSGMGVKVEDYLKHIKKTPEDLRKEWLPDAEKRAKLNLVLAEIAKKENIVPDRKLVDDNVEYLLKQYKDADLVRTRAYVEHQLTLAKTIEFLEGVK